MVTADAKALKQIVNCIFAILGWEREFPRESLRLLPVCPLTVHITTTADSMFTGYGHQRRTSVIGTGCARCIQSRVQHGVRLPPPVKSCVRQAHR